MSKSKPNRSKIQRTQADVDRARQKGMEFGVEFCLNVVLFVLKDKHSAQDEDILQFRNEIMYLMDSIGKKYVSYPDIKKALKDEYGLTVYMSDGEE